MNDNADAVLQLTRGATGFSPASGRPLPLTDRSALRSACASAARHARGRLGETVHRGTDSFTTTALSAGAGQLVAVVVCHLHLPLVAFTAEPLPPFTPVTAFIDPPTWAEAFTTEGFQVLDRGELQTPLPCVDLSALDPVELRQVRSWRPELLAELLFNSWD